MHLCSSGPRGPKDQGRARIPPGVRHPAPASGLLLAAAVWPAVQGAQHRVHEGGHIGEPSWQLVPLVELDAAAQGVGALSALAAHLVPHLQVLTGATGEGCKAEGDL